MALEWKSVFTAVGIISLCFLGIPIKLNSPAKNEMHVKMFSQFMSQYNRSYDKSTIEYEERLLHFQESLSRAETFNLSRTLSSSAMYGVTKFSDLSPDEFAHKHLLPSLPKHLKKDRKQRRKHKNHHIHKRAVDELPMKVDWRDKHVVTPIKNQKACGACWAFSTVETIESMVAIKNGTLKPLSVQQSVDCAMNGNQGCAGGDTCRVLEWMFQDKIGLLPETNYPYKGATGACHLTGPTLGVRIASNFTCDDVVGNEDLLLATLATHGPVAVAVNALNWQTYLGGVIQYHCDGDPVRLNHAVQIVGYDRSAPIPHYIVRNSWGTDFGDKGYLYIAIGGNICGLANEVSSVDII